MGFVDQHAGRRHLLDRTPVQRRFAQRHGRAHGAPELHEVVARPDRPKQPRQQARLVASGRGGAVDARGPVDGAEQPRRIIGGFRGAQE